MLCSHASVSLLVSMVWVGVEAGLELVDVDAGPCDVRDHEGDPHGIADSDTDPRSDLVAGVDRGDGTDRDAGHEAGDDRAGTGSSEGRDDADEEPDDADDDHPTTSGRTPGSIPGRVDSPIVGVRQVRQPRP